MRMQIRNQPDFLAGALFAVVGAAFALAATRYEVGTAAQMGPAQFPLILGSLLALFGLGIMFRSVTAMVEAERIAPISLRPLVLILGSVALFGLLLIPFGMVVASVLLVLVSALASHEFHWRYAALTAFTLVVACYLIFVYGLGLPLPVFPWGR